MVILAKDDDPDPDGKVGLDGIDHLLDHIDHTCSFTFMKKWIKIPGSQDNFNTSGIFVFFSSSPRYGHRKVVSRSSSNFTL